MENTQGAGSGTGAPGGGDGGDNGNWHQHGNGHWHDHDHDHDDAHFHESFPPPEHDNIWHLIDKEKIQCLNEEKIHSCKEIFRDEDDRMEFGTALKSPQDDPELVLIIPFTEEVKVRAVQFIAETGENRPNVAGLYINEENIDFSIVDEEPLQSFEVNDYTPDHQHQLTTKYTKFVRVQKLVVHLKGDVSQLSLVYFAVMGKGTKAKRQIVHADYEVAGMIGDHAKDIEKLLENKNNTLL